MRYEKDIKRIEAFNTLIKLGVLTPLDENIELYHGRSGTPNKEWEVDKQFSKSENNGVSILSTTTDKSVAEAYANLRAEYGGVPEVHRIVPYRDGSYILSAAYRYEDLDELDREEMFLALKELSSFSVSELSPVDFGDRTVYSLVYDNLKEMHVKSGYSFISQDMCDNVVKKLSHSRVSPKLVNHIAGAINAKLFLMYDPNQAIQRYINGADTENVNNFRFVDSDGKSQEGPLSQEYISAWLYNNNIIGVKDLVTAIAVNKKFNGVHIFDTSKVNTQKAVGEKLQSIMGEFGVITKLLDNFTENEEMKEFFKKATPQEMIKFAKGVDKKYKVLLEGDSGNWEGYSVAQHTEAVLRNFEDAYGDDVPEELYPFIKFMILTHDLGKSKGRMSQKYENAKACAQFCKDLDINPNIEPLIQFIIGDSQHYTTDYYVMKNKNAQNMLLNGCRDVLKSTLKSEPSENMVNGLASICKILQTCDSGAYTAYGVIRDEENEDLYYRGGNYSWTKGFSEPTDSRKRHLRFTQDERN